MDNIADFINFFNSRADYHGRKVTGRKTVKVKSYSKAKPRKC